MSTDAQRLNALSQAVLQLHRGSRDWAAASFDARAAELLAGVVAFDACLWGSTRADAVPGTALSLLGLYSQGLQSDALADLLAGGGPAADMSVQFNEPLAGRRVELHLWRRVEQPRFEPDDRNSLMFLMPHLVETQRENRLSRAQAAATDAPPRRSLALCDGQGLLQQVDEQGMALLRSEWPLWLGTRLPEPLVLAVQAADGAGPLRPYYGRSITVLMARSGTALLLEIRRRVDADRLSGRQRDIALLYAAGPSSPQFATRLGLSPSTTTWAWCSRSWR